MRTEPIFSNGRIVMGLLIAFIVMAAALGIYKVHNSPLQYQASRDAEFILYPPNHLFVKGVVNVCVVGESRLFGADASIRFSFSAGQAVSPVFTRQSGVQCVQYEAPASDQIVVINAFAETPLGTMWMPGSVPIYKDQF